MCSNCWAILLLLLLLFLLILLVDRQLYFSSKRSINGLETFKVWQMKFTDFSDAACILETRQTSFFFLGLWRFSVFAFRFSDRNRCLVMCRFHGDVLKSKFSFFFFFNDVCVAFTSSQLSCAICRDIIPSLSLDVFSKDRCSYSILPSSALYNINKILETSIVLHTILTISCFYQSRLCVYPLGTRVQFHGDRSDFYVISYFPLMHRQQQVQCNLLQTIILRSQILLEIHRLLLFQSNHYYHSHLP